MAKNKKKTELWVGLNHSEWGVDIGELKIGSSSKFSYMSYPVEIFLTKSGNQLQINVLIPDLGRAFSALNDKGSN